MATLVLKMVGSFTIGLKHVYVGLLATIRLCLVTAFILGAFKLFYLHLVLFWDLKIRNAHSIEENDAFNPYIHRCILLSLHDTYSLKVQYRTGGHTGVIR